MYKELFSKAVAMADENISSGIGTYKERSQHRILKFFFESDVTFHEIPIRSYIADICKNDQIYEIQTSGFGNLTSKLEDFLVDHKVSVIYPASTVKTVVWTDPESGDMTFGRKVRKNSVKFKLLSELIYIKQFIGAENFSIIVAETEINDIRLLDGRGAERKIKATKLDKVPKSILSLREISTIEDIKNFAELEDNVLYTRNDLQKKFQLKGRNFSVALKALILLGVLEEHSKEKRKIIYKTC